MSEGFREDFSSGGDLARFVESLDTTRHKWLAKLIRSGLLAKLSYITRTQFSDYVVPGVYQDPIYMEAVMRHSEPKVTEEQLAQNLVIGQAIKTFFCSDRALDYLTEKVISRPFEGSYKTISDLAERAQSGAITVRIVPDAAVAKDLDGLGAIAGGALTYFGFGREAYFENEDGPQINMSEQQAAKLFRAAARHAYHPDQSLSMLGAAAAVHQAEGR